MQSIWCAVYLVCSLFGVQSIWCPVYLACNLFGVQSFLCAVYLVWCLFGVQLFLILSFSFCSVDRLMKSFFPELNNINKISQIFCVFSSVLPDSGKVPCPYVFYENDG